MLKEISVHLFVWRFSQYTFFQSSFTENEWGVGII